jgi:hypothetical protein
LLSFYFGNELENNIKLLYLIAWLYSR